MHIPVVTVLILVSVSFSLPVYASPTKVNLPPFTFIAEEWVCESGDCELYMPGGREEGFVKLRRNKGSNSSDDTFNGTIKDDKLVYGNLLISGDDGFRYIGEFKNGKFHGVGFGVDSSGTSYRGEFRNGILIEEVVDNEADKLKNSPFTFPEEEWTCYPEYESQVDCKNGLVTLSRDKGKNSYIDRYRGSLKDGKPHGLGKLAIYAENSKDKYTDKEMYGEEGFEYSGIFKNGLFHGEGKLIDSSGEYEGKFHNGVFVGNNRKLHGHGVLTIDYATLGNHGTIEGEWENGELVGIGNFTYRDNKVYKNYVGEFKNNKFHGQGTLFYLDGGKAYEGEWENGKEHGQGTSYYSDGSKEYVGGFKYGDFSGQGIGYLKDGGKYVGEFKGGQYHGYGTYTDPTGIKLVGEFKRNKFHGQGTRIWSDGTKFEGQFVNDLPVTGQGTLTLANGEQYTGEFEYKYGKFHLLDNNRENDNEGGSAFQQVFALALDVVATMAEHNSKASGSLGSNSSGSGSTAKKVACAYNYPTQRCREAGWRCVPKSQCDPSRSSNAAGTFRDSSCNCTKEKSSGGKPSSGNCNGVWTEGLGPGDTFKLGYSDIQAKSFCQAACEAKRTGKSKDYNYNCGMIRAWGATKSCSVCN